VIVKTFIMLQKMSVSNKCCSFLIMVSTKILRSTIAFNIDDKKWFLSRNQDIRMISEHLKKKSVTL